MNGVKNMKIRLACFKLSIPAEQNTYTEIKTAYAYTETSQTPQMPQKDAKDMLYAICR